MSGTKDKEKKEKKKRIDYPDYTGALIMIPLVLLKKSQQNKFINIIKNHWKLSYWDTHTAQR
jgi:hypothetical protein